MPPFFCAGLVAVLDAGDSSLHGQLALFQVQVRNVQILAHQRDIPLLGEHDNFLLVKARYVRDPRQLRAPPVLHHDGMRAPRRP